MKYEMLKAAAEADSGQDSEESEPSFVDMFRLVFFNAVIPPEIFEDGDEDSDAVGDSGWLSLFREAAQSIIEHVKPIFMEAAAMIEGVSWHQWIPRGLPAPRFMDMMEGAKNKIVSSMRGRDKAFREHVVLDRPDYYGGLGFNLRQ